MSALHDTPELVLRIDVDGAGDSYRDDLAHRLLREIRDELGVDVRPLADSDLPKGAKGADAMAIATLVMPLLASIAPKLIDLLKDWAMRGEARTLKLVVRNAKNESTVIEYDPKRTSAKELQKLVELARGE